MSDDRRARSPGFADDERGVLDPDRRHDQHIERRQELGDGIVPITCSVGVTTIDGSGTETGRDRTQQGVRDLAADRASR